MDGHFLHFPSSEAAATAVKANRKSAATFFKRQNELGTRERGRAGEGGGGRQIDHKERE